MTGKVIKSVERARLVAQCITESVVTIVLSAWITNPSIRQVREATHVGAIVALSKARRAHFAHGSGSAYP